MKGTMLALVKKDLTHGIHVEEVPIPQIAPDQVLVKIRASGICGSDVHMYEGDPSYEMFVPYMPVIVGHEFSGDVVEVGSAVKHLKLGDRVTCKSRAACGTCYYCVQGKPLYCETPASMLGFARDGGMAEYIAVEEKICITLPQEIGYDLGALIEPLGVSANTVIYADIQLGETVVIQGPGCIGLLAVLFAKANGCGNCIVIGTNKDKQRLEIAKQLGANYIINASETDPLQAVRELTAGRGAGVVIEASGAVPAVQTAVDMCEKAGRVILAGIYASAVTIDATPMVRASKSIISSYSSPPMWERITDWLVANPGYAAMAEKIITHRSKLQDGVAAFERSVHKENTKELFIMD